MSGNVTYHDLPRGPTISSEQVIIRAESSHLVLDRASPRLQGGEEE